MTDFATQYFLSNTLFGSIGNSIPLDSTYTIFYYNSSSSPGSTTPSIGMN